MSKHYYCPYCGTLQLSTNIFCIKCRQAVKLVTSQYDSEYYREKSQEIYGDYQHWHEFLLPEIKNNPLFNESKFLQEMDARPIYQPTVKQPNPNQPKCPTCGSTNIEKISVTKRAVHGAVFGLFSSTARSQMQCKNCGYKW